MTLSSLQTLASTDEGRERIRVMVAELMGWKRAGTREGAFNIGPIQLWAHPSRIGRTPDLPRLDLNACAEFEAGLTDEEHGRFQGFLYDLTLMLLGVSAPFKPHERKKVERAYVSASALHRCMAFILTKQATKGAE